MFRAGLWRQPDFLKLWTGQTVSQIGSSISTLGIPLTALYLLRATPRQMGLLSGAGGAAILIFGLFAGAWADRLRRRPILIFSDLGRAALLATIPLAAAFHRLTMGHLYLLAASTGILTVFFDAGYQAYLPSLIAREQLVEGNSKLALSASTAEIAGPGLTGALISLMTAPAAILFDAVSFLFSGLSILLIRKPEPKPVPAPQPHLLREIAEGLRACGREPVLRALALRSGTAAFCLGFIGSLYMIFVVQELHVSAVLLGGIISIGGASSLAGTLVAARMMRLFGPGRTLIGASLTTATAFLLVLAAHGPVTECLIFLGTSQLFDAAWSIYNITEQSLIQAIAPPHLLGRVSSALHLLFRGVMPAGAVVGGLLAESLGVRQTMFAGTLGFLASTLWLVFSPVRDLREMPAPS
ncbi:MAG: MFS transporter [Acidobacteriota bacterium]